MTTPYTHILDLAKEVQPPDKGILSRTVFNDDRLKAVIFGFAQGEELSEHTASMPAVLHFLQGEAKLTLGDDTLEAKLGTWVHMPTGLRHSIRRRRWLLLPGGNLMPRSGRLAVAVFPSTLFGSNGPSSTQPRTTPTPRLRERRRYRRELASNADFA